MTLPGSHYIHGGIELTSRGGLPLTLAPERLVRRCTTAGAAVLVLRCPYSWRATWSATYFSPDGWLNWGTFMEERKTKEEFSILFQEKAHLW
jgi:hypothetical protein